MPTISQRVALTANGTAFPLVGSTYEFLTFPALIEVGIGADATGVLATFTSGPDVLMDEGPVPVKAINTYPVYPDDFFLSDEAAPSDRLRLVLRDTSAAARVVMVSVRITPM